MAARGINKVILVGNLGNDPETRATQSGSMVTRISVATNEKWKDKQTGQTQERTEWHRVVFFGRLAEIVSEYLRKGSMVYIEGSLRTNKWQDKSGQDRYTTEVIGSEMQMLGGSRNDQGGGYQGSSHQGSSHQGSSHQGSSHQGSAHQGGAAQNGNTRREEQPAEAAAGDDFDDDIPF